MKNKILLPLLCVVCMVFTLPSMAKENTETETEMTEKAEIDGFRDFEWGTPKEEIEESVISGDMYYNKDFVYIDPNIICMLKGSVSDYNASVYYEFDDNDALVAGMYGLNEIHTDYNAYYDDYCRLVELYTEIYGEPSGTIEDWSNDTYKDDESKIGMALSLGYVTLSSRWDDDKGDYIIMAIYGDNYEIKSVISYRSSDYSSSTNTDGI